MKKKTILLISFILEAVLGFPVLGGSIIMMLFWTPLMLGLAWHIVVLVMSKEKKSVGTITSIVANSLGWIPVLGMCMHLVSFGLLLNDYLKEK